MDIVFTSIVIEFENYKYCDSNDDQRKRKLDEADKIVTKVIFVQHIPMMNIDVGWCALDYNRECRGLLLCTMSTLQTTLAGYSSVMRMFS